MTFIYILDGNSGSGKDTFYELGKNIYQNQVSSLVGVKLKKISFVSSWKRFCEECFQLPKGSLDLHQVKRSFIKDVATGETLSITYLDFLKKSFHLWDKLYPNGSLLAGQVLNEFDDYASDFVVTDLRKQWELDFLLKLASDWGYKIVYVKLHRLSSIKEDTDGLVDWNPMYNSPELFFNTSLDNDKDFYEYNKVISSLISYVYYKDKHLTNEPFVYERNSSN